MKLLIGFLSLVLSQSVNAQTCTEFSGNWTGQCVLDNGQIIPLTKLKLAQKDCTHLDYGTGSFEIGKTENFNFKAVTYDDVRGLNLFRWNENRSILEREMTLIARHTTGGAVHTEMAYGTWKIENAKLIVDQKWFEYTKSKDVTKEVIVRSVCTYERQ